MFKNLNASALGVSGHQSEIIELALTYGFQGLDIDISEFAIRVKLHGLPYARRLIDSARLRLGTFSLPLDCTADDATFQKRLEKLGEYGRVAQEMGCPRCTVILDPASDKRPYHENFEFYRQRLGAVAGVLEPFGVRLGVGFRAAEALRKGQAFQFIHDLDALSLLLSMLPASNVGLLLDVWELYVAGGSVETIRALRGETIVAVQVANMPADVPLPEIKDTDRLLPGAEGGVIDLTAVLTALSEIGYNGPVTPKPSRAIFKNLRRDAIVKETADGLGKAWKAAGLSTARLMPVQRS